MLADLNLREGEELNLSLVHAVKITHKNMENKTVYRIFVV